MSDFVGVQRFARNTQGRDLVVGDLHGMRDDLLRQLERVGFDDKVDRVFCVGDLVDRGPHSQACVELLDQPWFHSVMGNHDFSALVHFGAVLIPVPPGPLQESLIATEPWHTQSIDAAAELSARIVSMPFVIEIETDAGLIGITHAGTTLSRSQYADWQTMTQDIDECMACNDLRPLLALLWDRKLMRVVKSFNAASVIERVDGITHTIHGHMITRDAAYMPIKVGNHWLIDGGAFLLRQGWPSDWEATPRLNIVDAREPWEPL